MNCICGCGRRVGRGEVDLNILAGELALELVVWDRVRSLRLPLAADEVELLLASGAPRYQELLGAIHGDTVLTTAEIAAVRSWLDDSRGARQRLGGELPTLPKKKIELSREDRDRLDRAHPERTFGGGGEEGEEGGEPDLEVVLLRALQEVRSGRSERAEAALRRFLSG